MLSSYAAIIIHHEEDPYETNQYNSIFKKWMGPNPNGPYQVSCHRAMKNTQLFPGSVQERSCWRVLGGYELQKNNVEIQHAGGNLISSQWLYVDTYNPNKPNKPIKSNKPNNPNKPNKPNKPNNPNKPNKPNNPNKPNKPNKPTNQTNKQANIHACLHACMHADMDISIQLSCWYVFSRNR